MNVPTKKQQAEQIAALMRENEALEAVAYAAARETWARLKPLADKLAAAALQRAYGCALYNLQFDHVDRARYWYRYSVQGMAGRQTYGVTHKELEEGRTND